VRYGLGPGDIVFVMGIRAGELLLLARVRLERVIPASEYRPVERPLLGHQQPFGCVDEAGLVAAATPLRLDVIVPTSILEQLQLRNTRGQERALPLKDGRVKPLSIQGHFFRLTERAADVLERFLAQASVH
jgi:hypothetical protein